ncbi:hypothetical protein, partial [Morganella morganii]|uniref:hypothetical protein n=1 Tax=Morganella morganii TaxID=582 RepID=UPI0023676A95
QEEGVTISLTESCFYPVFRVLASYADERLAILSGRDCANLRHSGELSFNLLNFRQIFLMLPAAAIAAF